MTDEEATAVTPILENVGRLVSDAGILIGAGSYPSAFVLSVIALEECGKIVQLRWRQLGLKTSGQKRTAHLQKQWAVACLLIANKVLPFYVKILTSPPEQQGAGLVELAANFIDSKERAFFEDVIAVNLDRAKQLGLYEDDTNAQIGRTRDDIGAAAVQQINETISEALPLLENDVVVQVASVFFEIMPPFKDDILAQKDAPEQAS